MRPAAIRERAFLVTVLLAAAGTWAFAYIADEVVEDETHPFDTAVLRAFRTADGAPAGPPWLVEAARDVTSLGGYLVLLMTTLFVVGFLALERRRLLMLVVLASSIGGGVLSMLLKNAFERPRPAVVSHLVPVASASFPSGHAMASAAIYVTLAALLARTTTRWAVRLYFLAVALGLTGIVGVSRVYLGVHYPTDVLAGWTAGTAWALLCHAIALALQRRGRVEPPAVES